MLADNQIEKLIKDNKIKIKPFKKKYLKTSRCDIHLGENLLIPHNTQITIDLSNPKVQPKYHKVNIRVNPYTIKPGEFILGQTLEQFELDSDIGLILDGSSTPARLGLTIHQSSLFIPPGQDLHVITLEIYNAGPWKIKLTYMLRIGKIIGFRSTQNNSKPTKIQNRYNAQKVTTGAIIMNNNEE